jgi:ABC-type nickel/cobalt efflux system permease component RcnA
MSLRRLLALFLLLATGLAQLETVYGTLRDAEVHHEDAASAAQHARVFLGDHGHEDAHDDHHEHGEGHQHGTGADHCTHQHGTAQPTTLAFALADVYASLDVMEPSTASGRTSSGFFRPPRV